MNFSQLYNSTMLSRSPKTAGLWQPKASSMRVGTDYMKSTMNKGYKDGENTLKLGDSIEISKSMKDAFGLAVTRAGMGLAAGSFRNMTDRGIDEIVARKDGNSDFFTPHDIFKTASGSIKMGSDENGRYLLIQGANDAETIRLDMQSDARVGFKDGHAVISRGSALGTGTLTAQGEDEFLLNVSGRDVQAGKNTTVFSSSKGGTFSGGDGVTYLGSYVDATIKAGTGINRYSGYFKDSVVDASASAGHSVFDGVYMGSDIKAGAGDDVFSGYFQASSVSGGDGENAFSGLFMEHSDVTGGADTDKFSGRFIDSRLDGKDGNDRFGFGVDMNANRVSREDEETIYTTITLDSDIINSTIETGGGNNTLEGVMFDSTVNLGGGDNAVNGVITGSTITAKEGNTRITAMYANGNTIDISGTSAFIAVGSAGDNAITAHTENTRIELGYNQQGRNDFNSVFTPSAGVKGYLWETKTLKPGGGDSAGSRIREKFGEVHDNNVDVSRGSATVILNNGSGTQEINTFDVYSSLQRKSLTVTDSVKNDTAPENAASAEKTQQSTGLLQGVYTDASELKGREQDTDEEAGTIPQFLGRYMSMRGDAPLMQGYLAAAIDTGVGAKTYLLGESDSNAALLWKTVGFQNPTEQARRAYLFGVKN